MKLLVDTNIVLEILLEQAGSAAAKTMLSLIQAHQFFMSDFSWHSTGLICARRNKFTAFRKFNPDMLGHSRLHLRTLDVADMDTLEDVLTTLGLDFDDAYQYVLAKKHDFTIVSFDTDFDKTPRGRMTPQAVIAASTAPSSPGEETSAS